MKTRKHRQKSTEICGRITEVKDGWKSIEIWGNAFQRGYAHGVLLHTELSKIKESIPFQVSVNFPRISYKQYSADCKRYVAPKVRDHFPEIYREMEGIVKGANSMDKMGVSIDDIIEWNAMVSMNEFYTRNPKMERCSAFIATGDATEKGDIVMAHNTHSDYVAGQYLNIIMTITPNTGFIFRMQTAAGLVSSATDWFLCEHGIIGCETTIADVIYKADFVHGVPYFCRIRKAMQYGKTLDDYVSIMLEQNAGDYPCSWLLGDTRTGEIVRFELGKNRHSVSRTKNGVFFGMNSAFDQELLDHEIKQPRSKDDTIHLDNTSGSRIHRFTHLLYDRFYGKINVESAISIIADHYNSYTNTDCMNRLGICKHMEYDSSKKDRHKKAYRLFGSTDGKVVNTEMSKKMNFLGRFGSACGRRFSIDDHIKKHPEYEKYRGYVQDFVSRPWTSLRSTSLRSTSLRSTDQQIKKKQ